MTRGFNLTLTAISVVSFGVGSAFAFTPRVGPVPDVIIGDRTPLDTAQPGDPFTHGDTLEDGLNQAEDVFDFPNAFNIFDLARDTPALAGFTSDEGLIYEFFATPVLPATTNAPSEQRISINGVRISTGGFTNISTQVVAADGELSFKDLAFTATSGGGDNTTPGPGVGAPWEPFTYTFRNPDGSSSVSTTQTTSPEGLTIDLIDVVAMSVRVRNTIGRNSSEDDFFVFTVNNGPDALSGDLILDGPNQTDLQAWSFVANNTQGAIGPSFPGDTGASATEVADTDGSVANLSISTGDTNGDFFIYFASPGSQSIPYVQDDTYHIGYEVQSTTPAANNPQLRFRWEYGVQGNIGAGYLVANGAVAPADADGRSYGMMFDQLDNLGAANATINGGNPATTAAENSVRLYFESIDLFDNTAGGGAVILDDLFVTRLNQASLLSNLVLERAATDYTAASIREVGSNTGNSANAIAVGRTATNATLTAPTTFAAGGEFALPYGFNFAMADQGIGLTPFAPSSNTGRAYRGSVDVNSAANTIANNLPDYEMQFAAFSAGTPPGQLYTSGLELNAQRAGAGNGGPGGLNPAYSGQNNYSMYLVMPEGASLNGSTLGSGTVGFATLIGIDVRLQDTDARGGQIVIDNLEISSFPENILP